SSLPSRAATRSGPGYGRRLEAIAQLRRPFCQSLHQPRLIGRLVRGDLLADILGAVLEQSIHTLRQLASGRYDRFGRTGTWLDASVEGPQGFLGRVTRLHG